MLTLLRLMPWRHAALGRVWVLVARFCVSIIFLITVWPVSPGLYCTVLYCTVLYCTVQCDPCNLVSLVPATFILVLRLGTRAGLDTSFLDTQLQQFCPFHMQFVYIFISRFWTRQWFSAPSIPSMPSIPSSQSRSHVSWASYVSVGVSKDEMQYHFIIRDVTSWSNIFVIRWLVIKCNMQSPVTLSNFST